MFIRIEAEIDMYVPESHGPITVDLMVNNHTGEISICAEDPTTSDRLLKMVAMGFMPEVHIKMKEMPQP